MFSSLKKKQKNREAVNYPVDWPRPVKPGHSFPRKVNDSVFELYSPEGQHELDILFFHGLQIGSYKNAYIETWQSGSVIWPQNLLPIDFPRARILSISYDSSARRSRVQGRMNLSQVAEVLLHDVVVSAAVGENCPVIMVGHSLGGIVIKQLCLEAEKHLRAHLIHRNRYVKKFVKHLKAIFYFSVPHGGSELANLAKNYIPSPGPMLDYLTVLSVHTEEINEDFIKLRNSYGWRAMAAAESLITKIGPFRAVVVTQESASRDVDAFVLLEEDHVSICKPRSQEDPSYVYFKDFVNEVT
ncbi:hypothetical protein R1sor_021042 [Riccia sorocarpa]|uniref:Uncharacterized protein n=1 Tax=Riccia sorocarpa TaxID=122646 RepID=A0ABD3GJL0_9MARC